MNYIFPFTPAWHNKRSMYDRRDDFQNQLQSAINQDPEILDSRNISVTLERGGMFHRNELHLIGEVHSEKDRLRAEEIVRKSARDSTDILNEIRVVDKGAPGIL